MTKDDKTFEENLLELENIVKELKCFGLKGIEVYHPSHSQSDINKFFNISRKHKLYVTGGSDYHGRVKECKAAGIGSYGLNEELLNKRIVVTGTLKKYTRDEIQNLIELNGGLWSTSVTKKTYAVIVGENPGSKYDKAKELNIPIWTEEDFDKVINS